MSETLSAVVIGGALALVGGWGQPLVSWVAGRRRRQDEAIEQQQRRDRRLVEELVRGAHTSMFEATDGKAPTDLSAAELAELELESSRLRARVEDRKLRELVVSLLQAKTRVDEERKRVSGLVTRDELGPLAEACKEVVSVGQAVMNRMHELGWPDAS